jgi:3-hydroxyacyl-CoA dehydrogenase
MEVCGRVRSARLYDSVWGEWNGACNRDDVWAQGLRNLYELAPEDPARERYRLPEFMERMIERGWLGEKRGQGLYKRVGPQKETYAIDWKTLEYHPAQNVRFASVETARMIEDLPQRLRALVAAEDRAGRFLWPLFRDVFVYSEHIAPEISDRIVEIDRAMRWGFAFPLGPFELWDALGVLESATRMRGEGCTPPASVERMLTGGAKSFYEMRRPTASACEGRDISIWAVVRTANWSRGPAFWCWRIVSGRAARSSGMRGRRW